MDFVDELRRARTARVAVVLEFLAQYQKGTERIHIFVEGHDDVVFYGRFVRPMLADGQRLYCYRCDSKKQVYEAYSAVTGRIPDLGGVMFFVDRDLDDLMATAWPSDPRIFVTDYYSIENYLFCADTVRRFVADSVRLSGVSLPLEMVTEQFDAQLARFHRLIAPLMAWILAARRMGLRPNLNDINLDEAFEISGDCEIRRRRGEKLSKYLARVTGLEEGRVVSPLFRTWRELLRVSGKRLTRGKFEAWFMLGFWHRATEKLQQLAKEGGGKAKVMSLERSTLVADLVPHASIPGPLAVFLQLHLRVREADRASPSRGSRLARLSNWFLNFLK